MLLFDTAYFSVPEYSYMENFNNNPTLKYYISNMYKIWKIYKHKYNE